MKGHESQSLLMKVILMMKGEVAVEAAEVDAGEEGIKDVNGIESRSVLIIFTQIVQLILDVTIKHLFVVDLTERESLFPVHYH